MEIWKYFTSALKGMPATRRMHQIVLDAAPDILSGVARLEELSSGSADDEPGPVFLLSAGWRSGSTLLQRLLMSDERLFIWGESYDHCGLVQSLAETTKAFTSEWPPQSYYYDKTPKEELASKWIADLYPSLDHLHGAHRAFFDTLFAASAEEAGAVRWGLKEVRLGIEHARYLAWLYPNARFVFLYRNPLDAYRSYCRYGRSWYDRWPDGPVFTPTAFGRHWRNIVEGVSKHASSVNGLTIRYEDLISKDRQDEMIDQLEAHLDISVDRSVMARKVGSSTPTGGKIWVSRFEKWLLRQTTSPIAEQLGYVW